MQIPILEKITDATEEPISLEEAKIFLRIDSDFENDLISSMIKAAVISAEGYTGKSFIKKKYKLSYDNYVNIENDIPKKPVINIEEARIINADNSVTIIDTSKYFLSSGNEKIIFDQEFAGKKIEIIFYSGMAENKSGVPEVLRQGLLNHIANMYERKIASSQIPDFSKTLYNFYKTLRV